MTKISLVLKLRINIFVTLVLSMYLIIVINTKVFPETEIIESNTARRTQSRHSLEHLPVAWYVSPLSPINAWSQVLEEIGLAVMLVAKRSAGITPEVTCMPLPSANKAAHSGFETQSRCHHKSKIGISVAPQKGLMSSINFPKKILPEVGYKSGTVNLNTVNSKFNLIWSFCEILPNSYDFMFIMHG